MEKANMYSLGVIMLECIFNGNLDGLGCNAAQNLQAVRRMLKRVEISTSLKKVVKNLLDE